MLFWIIECLFSTCGLVLGAVLAVLYYRLESNRVKEISERYDILRKRRQDEVRKSIERFRESLKDEKDASEITKQTLMEIREKVDKGELKAGDVLKAFQQKALKLHDKFNCLVEPVWEAESEARAVDEKKSEGLLAGIPVSIKDDVGIKGYNTTAGLARLIGQTSLEDSVIVKVLRKNGAAIFARTNIPQLELSVESSNPIYGLTKSPHNPRKQAGGSSGGEGCLIGGGGSPLGIGSDIGGSIRIPSHFNGICGFKPTSSRISRKGLPKFTEEPAIAPTWGPMARDVDSLVLAMRALWDGSMHQFDPLSPPVKFQNEPFEDKKPLKIGYFSDKFFPTPPVIQRAIDMAIEELKKQGHQVIEWTPPDLENTFSVMMRAMFADGGESFMAAVEGDKIDYSIKGFADAVYIPKFLKPLMALYAQRNQHEREAEAAAAMKGTKSVYEFYKLQSSIKEFQGKVSKAWKAEGLDALLSPTLPYPALDNGHPQYGISGATYTFFYNILDFPAGVVRMTKQTKEDIDALRYFKTNPAAKEQQEIKELMTTGEGMPVGVMVGALRWQDEKCLRVMKCVEKAADFIIQ